MTKKEGFFAFFHTTPKDNDNYEDSDDEDTHRLFKLRHWLASAEKDPYEATYQREESSELKFTQFVTACAFGAAMVVGK